jgi:hypothetical protein
MANSKIHHIVHEKGEKESTVQIEVDSPAFEAEVASTHMSLRGRKLTAAIAFVTGTGFTLFGYDQGVMSSLLTAKQVSK